MKGHFPLHPTVGIRLELYTVSQSRRPQFVQYTISMLTQNFTYLCALVFGKQYRTVADLGFDGRGLISGRGTGWNI
jgi:hypothetical protein